VLVAAVMSLCGRLLDVHIALVRWAYWSVSGPVWCNHLLLMMGMAGAGVAAGLVKAAAMNCTRYSFMG